MSKFFQNLICVIVLTTLLLLSFNPDWIGWSGTLVNTLFPFLIIIITLMWVIGFYTINEDLFTLYYKVVEHTDKSYNKFQAKKLQLYYILPLWRPVDEDYHSYETQNMFGATSSAGYSTEVKFSTKEEVLKAIKDDKKNVKEEWKEFFKRPKREKTKTYKA